jgi:putative Ca2+/H+ antiporter (TMEM165/GDT1 family)
LAARRLERRPFRFRIRAGEAALEAADRLTQASSQSRQLGGPEEKQRQRQHRQDLSDSESHSSSIPVPVGLGRFRDYSQEEFPDAAAVGVEVNALPLLSSFLLILLAELPDKTLYTVLLLATRNRPWPVLFGAWAAFLAHGFIAVGLANILRALPTWLLTFGTAGLFITFGLRLLFQRNEIGESADPLAADRVLTTSFWLVFVAEWGDATQIGTAALVARFPEHRWQVLSGATLGLWVGALLAVAIGRAAGHWLPEVAMRRVAGAVFCAFAIFTAVHGY